MLCEVAEVTRHTYKETNRDLDILTTIALPATVVIFRGKYQSNQPNKERIQSSGWRSKHDLKKSSKILYYLDPDIQKCATYARHRVAERSEKLWTFFSKFNQQYDFHPEQYDGYI